MTIIFSPVKFEIAQSCKLSGRAWCRPRTRLSGAGAGPCKEGRSRQAGFTLLELMISITLTAILLGMLSAGVYAVVNEWQRETSVLDRTLDKSLAMLQVERALLGAFPHSYVDQNRLARLLYFQGAADEISWISTVSPLRQPGLAAWRLRSAQDGITLSLTPAFGDDPDLRFDDAPTTLLLPGYSLQLRYLWQLNLEEKAWSDEWLGSEQQSLPLAVHVLFRPHSLDGRDDFMELVVPIKAWRHEDIQPPTNIGIRGNPLNSLGGSLF